WTPAPQGPAEVLATHRPALDQPLSGGEDQGPLGGIRTTRRAARGRGLAEGYSIVSADRPQPADPGREADQGHLPAMPAGPCLELSHGLRGSVLQVLTLAVHSGAPRVQGNRLRESGARWRGAARQPRPARRSDAISRQRRAAQGVLLLPW